MDGAREVNREEDGPPLAKLVIGTANRKKGRELAELYAPLGLEVLMLADFSAGPAVEENGETFRDNARIKAAAYARHLGHWVLADDSGLAVDVLGGEPGVHSARYSGPEATDASNNGKLLGALEGVPLERRGAQFVCWMALADPAGQIRAESEGHCRGRILLEPRGASGFGYDPLFEIVEYHRTFGELAPAVKACLSHRARASRQMIPQLDLLRC